MIHGEGVGAVSTEMIVRRAAVLAVINGHHHYHSNARSTRDQPWHHPGCNIFNGLWIIGIAAVICPIDVSAWQISIALVASLLTVLMLVPSRNGFIGRAHGIGLLIAYMLYITLVLRK